MASAEMSAESTVEELESQVSPRSLTAREATADSSRRLLEVRDLVVEYSGSRAVSGISLDVKRGEIVGLIGPNGAGKSSALNAISGDVKAAGGSIRLCDRNVTRLPAYRRARLRLARTSQTARVFEGLTVYEGLVTVARGAGAASLTRTLLRQGQRTAEQQASERAWQMLDDAGLAHIADFFGRELSGGQRRFVDLAMALIRAPELLLLDEPMVGVAPALLPKLMTQLRQVCASGTGILIVEHALEVVAALCDRVIVMAAGIVIAEGTYEEVTQDAQVRRAYLN